MNLCLTRAKCMRHGDIKYQRGVAISYFKLRTTIAQWSLSVHIFSSGRGCILYHQAKEGTLRIDRIDKSSGRWKRADILIFNTGHWWTHRKTSKGRDYYQEGDTVYPKFDPVEAYTRAMKTWAIWIDKNMNPRKNVVFYRGYSTAHFKGGEWDSGGTCNGETEPTFKGPILNNYPLKMRIVEDAIGGIRFPVILLNVTKLTNFRKDGHPAIYRKKWAEGVRVVLKETRLQSLVPPWCPRCME